MRAWDPSQYLRFESPRLRPALDLLAQVDMTHPQLVVDAGCGPGNVTPFLRQRWPDAHLVGVDSSSDMLQRAAAEHPDETWVEADLATWAPDRSVDVLYSNATLHWLDDHSALFRRLLSFVAPGGCLAVQMPHNHHAPTHTAIADTVEDGPWAERLRPLLRTNPVASAGAYRAWLADAQSVDVWQTEYFHVLEGDDAVAQWTRGSVLRPLLAALDEESGEQFFAEYAARVAAAYPREADGTTLLPFRRLFIVAYR